MLNLSDPSVKCQLDYYTASVIIVVRMIGIKEFGYDLMCLMLCLTCVLTNWIAQNHMQSSMITMWAGLYCTCSWIMCFTEKKIHLTISLLSLSLLLCLAVMVIAGSLSDLVRAKRQETIRGQPVVDSELSKGE